MCGYHSDRVVPGRLRVPPGVVARARHVRRHPVSGRDQVGAAPIRGRGRGASVQTGLSEPGAGRNVHPGIPAVEQLQPQQEGLGNYRHTHTLVTIYQIGHALLTRYQIEPTPW